MNDLVSSSMHATGDAPRLGLAWLAARRPRWVEAGIRLDRAPAFVWLALQALALLPSWLWMTARFNDGSDDPLGLLAVLALGVLLVRERARLRCSPALGWLASAAVLTVLATASRAIGGTGLSPLMSAALAVLALACGLRAFLPRQVPGLPLLGLALLALPLLSSLQFYAGYPLRVLTAEASRWLLAPLFEVMREGTSLWIAGRQVIVDAPCSGVQMAWFGEFVACLSALHARHDGRVFLRRLPVVGALVLLGNMLRNSLLVGLEAAGHAPAPWLHEALGLIVLLVVCAWVAGVMSRPAAPHAAARLQNWRSPRSRLPLDWQCAAQRLMGLFDNRFVHRTLHKAAFGMAMVFCIACIACIAWASAAHVHAAPASDAPLQGQRLEWPRSFDGEPLRPLASTAVEARFARQFPGEVVRFALDGRVLVWRQVDRPTRLLHPAADCYRALGFRVRDAVLERDAKSRLWRCFIAERDGGGRQRVCERIEDAQGRSFEDTSGWYWAAIGGRSTGPWQALTMATPIE